MGQWVLRPLQALVGVALSLVQLAIAEFLLIPWRVVDALGLQKQENQKQHMDNLHDTRGPARTSFFIREEHQTSAFFSGENTPIGDPYYCGNVYPKFFKAEVKLNQLVKPLQREANCVYYVGIGLSSR